MGARPMADNIKVFCRVRGLNNSERDTEVITEIDASGSQISVNADSAALPANRRTYARTWRWIASICLTSVFVRRSFGFVR